MNSRQIMMASLVAILAIPVTGQAQTTTAPGALRRSIEREAMKLAQARPTPAVQPAVEKRRSWAARHPIALGTILGIITGGTIAQISDGRVTNSDGRPIFLMGAIPGLVIGSSIGAVVAFAED